jgi:glucose-6-phosphate 1-epimerase
MAQTLEILQSEHSADGARWEQGSGGLCSLVVNTEQCTARLFAHGAHVASWTPLLPGSPTAKHPGLHLSPRSAFERSKAIRGGVPVCFPWFGPRFDDPLPNGKPSPAHGFARTAIWQVERVSLEDNGRLRVEMTLTSNAETKALWDADFAATLIASLGRTLQITLEVRNTGAQQIEYEEALHTYLEVGDVEKVQLLGLEGTKYVDKVDALMVKQTGAEPLVLRDETDNVFQGTKAAVIIVDPVLARHLKVEKTGSMSTVVWNPWLVKSQTIPDIGGASWRSFVCVEAANAGPHRVVLPVGAVHGTSTRISVIPQSR